MLVNSDFSRSAIVTPDQFLWTASPQPGVERVMLDRQGGEQARATSIVRYAAGSIFPHHRHPGGEEILVLSGTFSEGTADYPAGWYLRNPPGSSHQPHSSEGALIFVKLRQMAPDENLQMRIDTGNPALWQRQADRDVCPLFSQGSEQACLQRVEPGCALFRAPVDSAELLILAGEVTADGTICARGSWIRLPAGNYPAIIAGAQGATYYLKTGHLAGDAAAR